MVQRVKDFVQHTHEFTEGECKVTQNHVCRGPWGQSESKGREDQWRIKTDTENLGMSKNSSKARLNVKWNIVNQGRNNTHHRYEPGKCYLQQRNEGNDRGNY